MRRFRIHPAVGVARVGNSPEEFFVGPERPLIPANSNRGAFESFRDPQGRIERQAARFRVFEYVANDRGGLDPVEVKLADDVKQIEWRVHLANRKGSFFTFNGQSGAEDLYAARSENSIDAPEKHEDGEPVRLNRRNSDVKADRRERLDLDPGERVVNVDSPGPVVLTNPNAEVPFIADLGEIRMTPEGHLLVLGGHGVAGSNKKPAPEIDEYANNDTWFDDVSDGSVKARIRLQTGEVIDADAAWVVVGPPDFAPTVTNAVSLYDLMWDLAVREFLPVSPLLPADVADRLNQQQAAWRKSGGASLAGYEPSFKNEIYPILTRALDVRQLHEPPAIDKKSYHLKLMDMDVLAKKDPSDSMPHGLRQEVFRRIRSPNNPKIDWKGMPRGLGDFYDHEDDPRRFFSFTKIQYALLEQWAADNFNADWDGTGPNPTEDITPAGLDRAATENCVGGPFYPGIEVSWLIRQRQLYAEPFRLEVSSKPESEADAPKKIGSLTFEAGFFSQQMAQPWHADFFDCQKEDEESTDDQQVRYYIWWTAQRPDDTFAKGVDEQAPWVRHIVPGGQSLEDVEETSDRFKFMVENWSKLPFVLPNGDRLEEEPL